MSAKVVALVTGANKGIGFEVARQLAQAEVHVLIGVRNPEKGAAAVAQLSEEGLIGESLPIDVTDLGSIADAAVKIAADFGRLDILVNNAGTVASDDMPPSMTSLSRVRQDFEVNFFGALAVTQAMLPLMGNSAPGRIVNVSSRGGSLGVNSDPVTASQISSRLGYAASKAAQNMFTILLNAELRGRNIKVNAVTPGLVKTDLFDRVNRVAARPIRTPAEGAEIIVRYALFDRFDAVSGKFASADGDVPW